MLKKDNPLNFIKGKPIEEEFYYEIYWIYLEEKGIQTFLDDARLFISLKKSGLQDAVYGLLLAQVRRLVAFLFDSESKGVLSEISLKKAISFWEELMMIQETLSELLFGLQQEILEKLKILDSDKELRRILNSLSLPSDGFIFETVEESLFCPNKRRKDFNHMNSSEIKKAILASWLFPLRQSVGSCFATAPAILIQSEQPYQFFEDMKQLVLNGEIKRVFDGVEYKAPFNLNKNKGSWDTPLPDLDDHHNVFLHPFILDSFLDLKWNYEFFDLEKQTSLLKSLLKESSYLTPKQIVASIIKIYATFFEKGVSKKQVQEWMSIFKAHFLYYENLSLLKSWEYTLASFSESKASLTSLNLMLALGVEETTPYSFSDKVIPVLNEAVNERILFLKQKEAHYEDASRELEWIQNRINETRNEQEALYLKAENYRRIAEIQYIKNEYEQKKQEIEVIQRLYPTLVKWYSQEVIKYFQEVYDPALVLKEKELFSDSPAGFCLFFKLGRGGSSGWKKIRNSEEYLGALKEFFIFSENSLLLEFEGDGLRKIISSCVTQIVHLVMEEGFFNAAVNRIRVGRRFSSSFSTPWEYSSGGTMDSLIQLYYMRSHSLSEKSTWVEQPTELLAFYIESIRMLTPSDFSVVEKNQRKRILAYSPTHAFSLLPRSALFYEGIKESSYVYSWIKASIVEPQKQFWQKQLLNENKILYLMRMLSRKIPEDIFNFLKQDKTFLKMSSVYELRSFFVFVLKELPKKTALNCLEIIDGVFFEELPFYDFKELKEITEHFLDKNIFQDREEIECLFSLLNYEMFVSRKELTFFLKSISIFVSKLHKSKLIYSFKECLQDYIKLIPNVVLFADSNWIHESFCFLVGPGSESLEFWRVKNDFSSGRRLTSWEPYLDGSVQNLRWGVYHHISEYFFR